MTRTPGRARNSSSSETPREAAIALSVVGEGMPLIYSGQEAGNDKRLEFFERDPIVWRDHQLGELYRKLFELKRTTSALWNAHWGARMIAVPNSAEHAVFSFVRRDERHKVFAVFNFSPDTVDATFGESLCHGTYVEFLDGRAVTVDDATSMSLEPWAYRILLQR